MNADRGRLKTRDRECLAGRGTLDNPPGLPQIGGDEGDRRIATTARPFEVGVDVVGEDERPIGAREVGDPFEFLSCPHSTGWVVRVRPQENICPTHRLFERHEIDACLAGGIEDFHAFDGGTRAIADLEEGRVCGIESADFCGQVRLMGNDVVDEGGDAVDDSGEEMDVGGIEVPGVATGLPGARGAGEVVEDLGVPVGAVLGGGDHSCHDLRAGAEFHVGD
ncbi:Uncharacterised protein [Chlamydia trachomatis]|nr:Uncharacterised protein [Chlamydia trachomatis]